MDANCINITNLGSFDMLLNRVEYVIVYGTGRMSEYLYQYLKYRKLERKIKYYCVSSEVVSPTYHHGNLVVSVTDIKEKDVPFVLGMAESNQREVKKLLSEKNVLSYALSDDVFVTMKYKSEYDESNKHKEDALDILKKRTVMRQDGILFLSPPYWDIYAPFSAVPSLVARLRKNNVWVNQIDLGIECFHVMLNREWKLCAGIFQSEDFYNRRVTVYKENPYDNYKDYIDSLWFFQGDRFQVDEVKKKYSELNKVQAGVLSEFYQYVINRGTTPINLNSNRTNLTELVQKTSWLNLWETIHQMAMSELSYLPPIVGISVTSLEQLLSACKIAEILREIRPDIKLIMGGSCASLFMTSLYAEKRDIYNFFDYVIVGEGETAIVQLYEHLSGGLYELHNIPNMAYVDDQNNVTYTTTLLEDVNTLPTPDYSDLNLNRYIAPNVILPYQASRGCHYGFCAFCNHHENYRHNYRMKTPAKIIEELQELSNLYDVKHFQFVDEAIRPDHFTSIVNEMDLCKELNDIHWIFYSRVSMEYTRDILQKAYINGCRMVMFGVETFNQRLLNFIKKGINADVAKYCLKLFHECGIKTFAWMLCNLPSERVHEVRDDIEEAKRNAENVDAYSVGMFSLERNTDMYKSPEKYNIVTINDNQTINFDSHYDGVIIDKGEMLNCFFKEYLPFIEGYYFTSDRYFVYFQCEKDREEILC